MWCGLIGGDRHPHAHGRSPVLVKLSVPVRHLEGGWYIAHYQVSRLGQ